MMCPCQLPQQSHLSVNGCPVYGATYLYSLIVLTPKLGHTRRL
jgi:hypothetical protein